VAGRITAPLVAAAMTARKGRRMQTPSSATSAGPESTGSRGLRGFPRHAVTVDAVSGDAELDLTIAFVRPGFDCPKLFAVGLGRLARRLNYRTRQQQ